MGLKLEILITVAIVAIISVTLMVKFTHKSSNGERFTKELEFTDTILTEVDTATMQGRAFGSYGIRDRGVLTLHDIRYHTNNIKLLRAKKGTYKGDKLYLDGNITVNQKEGFDYSAQHAVYDKKTKILDITSAFTAIMGKNIIHGYTLRYDTQKKEAFGKRIDAVVYTTEK
jgi:type II secretory pathway pseudopilin PulG